MIKASIGSTKFDEKSERKIRSDKKIRVNITTTQDTHEKLKRLSVSCDMSKTALAEDILRMALNHTEIIAWYQDQYNKNDQYRVIPIKENGKVYYQ